MKLMHILISCAGRWKHLLLRKCAYQEVTILLSWVFLHSDVFCVFLVTFILILHTNLEFIFPLSAKYKTTMDFINEGFCTEMLFVFSFSPTTYYFDKIMSV